MLLLPDIFSFLCSSDCKHLHEVDWRTLIRSPGGQKHVCLHPCNPTMVEFFAIQKRESKSHQLKTNTPTLAANHSPVDVRALLQRLTARPLPFTHGCWVQQVSQHNGLSLSNPSEGGAIFLAGRNEGSSDVVKCHFSTPKGRWSHGKSIKVSLGRNLGSVSPVAAMGRIVY